jgi:hypothetical protein
VRTLDFGTWRLQSCQIGTFWSAGATLTFLHAATCGEERTARPTVATENGAQNDHAIENEKINSSCITHTTQKEIAKAVTFNDLSRDIPLFSLAILREIGVPRQKE